MEHLCGWCARTWNCPHADPPCSHSKAICPECEEKQKPTWGARDTKEQIRKDAQDDNLKEKESEV